MTPLQLRLARVRRSLRFVVSFRGVSLLIAAGLVMVAAAALLDWRLHLPALVRALLLVGILSGTACIGYRHLFGPLLARADDLTLALRVETRYPVLNDSLASTVEFLEQSDDGDRSGSPRLRRHAVERAMRQAQDCDFATIVDRRGIGTVGLSLVSAAAAAGALVSGYSAQSATALAR